VNRPRRVEGAMLCGVIFALTGLAVLVFAGLAVLR
jgi:hypothetical protein